MLSLDCLSGKALLVYSAQCAEAKLQHMQCRAHTVKPQHICAVLLCVETQELVCATTYSCDLLLHLLQLALDARLLLRLVALQLHRGVALAGAHKKKIQSAQLLLNCRGALCFQRGVVSAAGQRY
jgi:hypothetical protein